MILVVIGMGPLGGYLLSLSKGLWGEALWYGLLFAAVAFAPVAALIPTLRRAARAGYGLNDLVHALIVDREHQEEEAQDRDGPYVRKLSLAALVARRTTWAAVGIAGVGFLMLTTGSTCRKTWPSVSPH